MNSKTKRILDYVSKGAMIAGLIAQLVGSIVDNKRNTIEIQEAVREELTKQTANAMKRSS